VCMWVYVCVCVCVCVLQIQASELGNRQMMQQSKAKLKTERGDVDLKGYRLANRKSTKNRVNHPPPPPSRHPPPGEGERPSWFGS